MNQRQAERHLFFAHIFKQMPLWEVWERDDATVRADSTSSDSRDFRSIPRHLRRSMARVRAKREWANVGRGGQ